MRFASERYLMPPLALCAAQRGKNLAAASWPSIELSSSSYAGQKYAIQSVDIPPRFDVKAIRRLLVGTKGVAIER